MARYYKMSNPTALEIWARIEEANKAFLHAARSLIDEIGATTAAADHEGGRIFGFRFEGKPDPDKTIFAYNSKRQTYSIKKTKKNAELLKRTQSLPKRSFNELWKYLNWETVFGEDIVYFGPGVAKRGDVIYINAPIAATEWKVPEFCTPITYEEWAKATKEKTDTKEAS